MHKKSQRHEKQEYIMSGDMKRSEKIIEGEDMVRTVDCLRGRLLAERVASRNAKEAAEQLGNKLIRLEIMLNQEAKSRNRAEKKLRFLMKKLESKNIPYVSDESDRSISVDVSDISSISSLASSTSTKESQEKGENQESVEDFKSSEESGNIDKIGFNAQESEMGSYSYQIPVSAIVLENLELHSAEKSSYVDRPSAESSIEEGHRQINDLDSSNDLGNSMALILIEPPKKSETIDPEVLDATVKEVLDALRHAKEQLQNSMEKQRRTKTVTVG